MVILDLIIIIVIILFVFFGCKAGFIETGGSILGLILASFIAGKYYETFATNNVSKALFFIITFLIVGKLIGLLFYLVGRFFKIFQNIPFLRTFDCALGGILGVFEGILICGVILFFVNRNPISNWILEETSKSWLANTVIYLTSFILPLLPESLRHIAPKK